LDKTTRIKLREVNEKLDRVLSVIEAALDRELECMGNFPENLQGTERYEKMEDAADNLENAVESINEAKKYLENVME